MLLGNLFVLDCDKPSISSKEEIKFPNGSGNEVFGKGWVKIQYGIGVTCLEREGWGCDAKLE